MTEPVVTEPDPKGSPAPVTASGQASGGPPSPDEFSHVPAPRRRPPLVALLAVGLALFLAIRVRHDVAYALSSATPRELGQAAAVVAAKSTSLPWNEYVRVGGLPDRESAVILDTQGSWHFTQLFRLHGTAGRVFVRRLPDPLPASLTQRDHFTGRLLPFSELSFGESIRKHFGAHVSATHMFAPAELARALQTGDKGVVLLTDLAGARKSLAPHDELTFERARPGEIRVELPKDRFPTAEHARKLLEQHGGTVVQAPVSPPSPPTDRHVLVVKLPDNQREQALSAIGDVDRRVRFRPARETLRARARDLSVSGTAMLIQRSGAPAIEVPLAELASVRTLAPVTIPSDAMIVLEGERPRDQIAKVVVLAFLLAFALVNLLALRRPA